MLNAAKNRRVFMDGGSGLPAVAAKWFVLSPAEEWYYRRWNLDYKPLPPFEDGSGRPVTDIFPLALFNPNEGARILVPRELDGSEGRIVFTAAHRDASARIYWHLDDEYLGATSFFHEFEARPAPGNRTLTLIDEAGNTLIRRFTVLDAVQ
jgi:penicillin-binding protein 1C